MKTMLKNGMSAAAIAAVALTAASAGADTSDARMLKETSISLIQAIQTAQEKTGGVAYEASLDDDSFTPAYEVNVVKDDKVYDVRIDGKTGAFIGSREDVSD